MHDNSVFSGVLDTLKSNWKVITVMAIIASIAAIIFTMPSFMPPRFESTAIVYPTNLYPLSEESETEQMLQLLADDDIKYTLIDQFKLYERVNLDPSQPEYHYWINLLYQERVSISPTRYESIEISCQDEDPVVAKEMVETILSVYNSEVNQNITARHEEYKRMAEGELEQLQFLMDSITTRIGQLRTQSGVLDFKSQSERYAEGYMRLIERGGSKQNIEKVETLMNSVAEKGSEVEMLQTVLTSFQSSYTALAQKVAIERGKVQNMMTYYQPVVKAQVSDKKVFPVRWIILVLSVALSVLATVIFLVAWDRVKSERG